LIEIIMTKFMWHEMPIATQRKMILNLQNISPKSGARRVYLLPLVFDLHVA